MEKFKVYVLNHITPKDGQIIRVALSDKTYEDIVKLSRASDQPIAQLAGKAIEYALSNIELVEV